MSRDILHKETETALCVVGGGMAGLCAALAAARHGAHVTLMQDRPAPGDNETLRRQSALYTFLDVLRLHIGEKD